MYHINDAISVDMWLKKVSGPDSPAIYYKPQGKVSSKPAILRNRHIISKTMELDVFEEDDIWLVKSSTVVSEFYSVTEKFKYDVTPPDKRFTPDATPSITMLRRHTAKESTAPCELQRTVKTPH
ncbi:hypothetical protein TNCV_344231 [Trichonephila clavipes]|nr:hypothetical protein TNCV_344231 [Trichonephila clavipes]